MRCVNVNQIRCLHVKVFISGKGNNAAMHCGSDVGGTRQGEHQARVTGYCWAETRTAPRPRKNHQPCHQLNGKRDVEWSKRAWATRHTATSCVQPHEEVEPTHMGQCMNTTNRCWRTTVQRMRQVFANLVAEADTSDRLLDALACASLVAAMSGTKGKLRPMKTDTTLRRLVGATLVVR